jgi:BirA family transcriptional regulator, biotin operon repressor / biotin---[acetyl-CoA-carboxylase] ligase
LSLLDSLVISTIQQGLSTSRFGRHIFLYEETESTNTVAMNLSKQGAEEGTLVLAEAQTKGRGRMGRSWHSPKGLNLYLSLALRPSCAAREIPWLGLTAAVALAKTIEQECGLSAKVKWPNDILIAERKAAGILTEAAVHLGHVESLILGVGVNLNMNEKDFPPELRSTATSLMIESGKPVDRIRFLQQLLASLEAWYGTFLQSSYEEIRRAYLALFELLDQPVRIQQVDASIRGTVTGISPEGSLELRLPGGEAMTIYSGDVLQIRTGDAAND